MKKTKKFLTGFTLIELLVVIAIIGLLASIVLVSFPSATKKANDSRVQSAISQTRALMVSYQATNGTYTGFSCTTPSEMVNLCAEVAAKGYAKANPTINVSATAVCIYASLNAKDGATYYCVDSTGIAGVTATSPAALFACPAGTTL